MPNREDAMTADHKSRLMDKVSDKLMPCVEFRPADLFIEALRKEEEKTNG